MQEITKGKWCKRVASASRIFFFLEKGRGIGMEYLESGRERELEGAFLLAMIIRYFQYIVNIVSST
jgi:hypothetical protein